jgi:uncharacterized membrane protein YtjA (UPF0391 family)
MNIVLAGDPGIPEMPAPDATLPFLLFVVALVVFLIWVRRRQ